MSLRMYVRTYNIDKYSMKLAVWYQKYLDTVMRSFACRLLYKWYRMLESGSTRMTPAINEPSPRPFIINFVQYTL